MIYAYIFNNEALKELTDSFLWYEKQQHGLGIEFRTEVFDKLDLVCKDPFHYRSFYKNYREAVTDRFPFLIIYFLDEKNNTVIVTAIFHTSRNPKHKFKRIRLK